MMMLMTTTIRFLQCGVCSNSDREAAVHCIQRVDVASRINYGARVSIGSVHILCYYFSSRFMLKVTKRCGDFSYLFFSFYSAIVSPVLSLSFRFCSVYFLFFISFSPFIELAVPLTRSLPRLLLFTFLFHIYIYMTCSEDVYMV